MARQHRTNSSKGRRRRYSNDGDSREEELTNTSSNNTSPCSNLSSRLNTSKQSEDDCKASREDVILTTSANNNTTTSHPSSTNPLSTSTTTSTLNNNNNTIKAEVIPAKLSQESYFGLNQDEFIHAFSSVIQEISSQGDMIPIEAQTKTQFHTSHPPRISLAKYMDRVIKFAFCSAECYILSLVYMDRLVQSNPNFVISSLSIHRLLITSIMVAAKFFDDKFYSNEYYANIGGIKKEEINKLEIEFLYMINFSLHFQPPEFEQYKEEFIVAPALKERALKKQARVVSSSKQQTIHSHHQYNDECSREESHLSADMALLSIDSKLISEQQHPRHSTPIY